MLYKLHICFVEFSNIFWSFAIIWNVLKMYSQKWMSPQKFKCLQIKDMSSHLKASWSPNGTHQPESGLYTTGFNGGGLALNTTKEFCGFLKKKITYHFLESFSGNLFLNYPGHFLGRWIARVLKILPKKFLKQFLEEFLNNISEKLIEELERKIGMKRIQKLLDFFSIGTFEGIIS